MADTNDLLKKVWNDSDNEAARTDSSHWRGQARWADDSRWKAIGEDTAFKVRALWRMLARPPFRCDIPAPTTLWDRMHRKFSKPAHSRKVTVLEWGPGGGSNILGLLPVCKTFFGVDIAAKNLDECTRMITEEGRGDIFQPILLSGAPSTVVGQIGPKVDLIISTAVFQHFPSKAYGVEVLNAMRALCHDRSAGIIQIRFDNGNERFKPITDLTAYEERHLTATSFALDEFWDLLVTAGFKPIAIDDIRPRINYATFYFVANPSHGKKRALAGAGRPMP